MSKVTKSIRSKILEALLLYFYFAAILILGYLIPITNYILFIFLFAGLPALFLALKLRDSFARLTIESLVITAPIGFVIEYICHMTRQWFVPGVTGIKIFNIYPIEEFLYAYIMAFSIIVFYKYFFDNYKKHILSKNFKILVISSLLLVILFTFLLIFLPSTLNIRYFYFWFMIAGLIFILITLFKYPRLYSRVSLYAFYMLPIELAYEILAVKLNYWSFEIGYHVGYINMFNVTIPIEELLFIILVPYFIVLIHEVFADNTRSS